MIIVKVIAESNLSRYGAPPLGAATVDELNR
jgi:hypothetical protein